MTYHGKKMETIHPYECVALTWEDAEKAEKLNAENKWGFTTPELLHMVADHMDATVKADTGIDVVDSYRKAEFIEWRLEDANFHTFCHALNVKDYKKAIQWVANEFEC